MKIDVGLLKYHNRYFKKRRSEITNFLFYQKFQFLRSKKNLSINLLNMVEKLCAKSNQQLPGILMLQKFVFVVRTSHPSQHCYTTIQYNTIQYGNNKRWEDFFFIHEAHLLTANQRDRPMLQNSNFVIFMEYILKL